MRKNILLSLRNITRHLTDKKINILLEHRIILSILIFILSTISIPFISNSFFISNTSALEYADNIGLEFTFNPTLSLSLSGNLIIDNLIPGSSSDSNSINVNISTNNVTGYNLSATVGSSNNATTNLTNTSNSNYTFTSLTSDTTNLTDFNPNTWGYSYSLDNGTTWSNYSGLPIYTTTGTNLNTTSINSSDTINFKIGAKADNTQPLGEYTNVINFKAVTNPAPTTFTDAFTIAGKTKHNGYYTMQDMTHSICEAVDIDANIQLIDVRDDEVYTIAKLKDENCWLLDNLRLDPTTANLTADNTNVSDGEQGGVAFTAQDIIDNFKQGGNPKNVPGWSNTTVIDTASISASSWPNTYTAPQVNTAFGNNTKDTIVTHYGIGSGKRGIYYNYCATTAGTYCYANGGGVNISDTLIDAPYDICPTNWRMPTGGIRKNETEQVDNPNQIGEYQILCNTLKGSNCTNGMTMTPTDRNSLQYQLGLTLSGNLYGNQPSNYDIAGDWWSSTYSNGSAFYNLYASYLDIYPMLYYRSRIYGFSIRCLAK